MPWQVEYNGFGAWTNLTIESVRYEPIEESDGTTARTLRGIIRGRGLIANANENDLRADIANVRAAFAERERRLLINNGATTAIVDIDPVSVGGTPTLARGYPRATCDIVEIAGTITAMVAFEIQWVEAPATDEDDDILSHWWQQRFNIDEAGLSTWTVNGGLHVADNAAGEPNEPPDDDPTQGPEPDIYRRLVFPAIPENFRVKSMEWAESEDGNRLLYQIVAQEHARPLPAPARRGSGTFTWRRAIESGDLLGVKSFDAELEGDANADRGELLASLLDAASNRITFAGAGSDQILSIEVTESDIFSRNRVGLRIRARGVASADNNPLSPGFNLLKSLVADGEQAVTMDPYGSALVRFVKRVVFAGGYVANDFPIAQTATVGEPTAAPTPYAIDETAIVADFETVLPPGQLTDETGGSAEHAEYPFLKVSVKERVYTEQHAIALKEQSINGVDYPYQTETPDLFLESEYEIIRQGKPAEEIFLKPVAGAMLIAESADIKPGEIDANNNRSYVTVYRRRMQVLRTPQSASRFVSESGTIDGITFFLRRAVVPNIAIGADPRRETVSEADNRTIETAPAGEPGSITIYTGGPAYQFV